MYKSNVEQIFKSMKDTLLNPNLEEHNSQKTKKIAKLNNKVYQQPQNKSTKINKIYDMGGNSSIKNSGFEKIHNP